MTGQQSWREGINNLLSSGPTTPRVMRWNSEFKAEIALTFNTFRQ